MEPSESVKSIPPYLFATISRRIAAARAKGVDVISFGIGDPDMPTPSLVVDELCRAARNPKTHQYPDYEGSPEFKKAVAGWYLRHHNVTLDPEKEVLALIGGKEGTLHACLALVNPGDVVLYPSPGYTPYKTSTIFAHGTPHPMPLLAENDFLPDLQAIPGDVAKKAKLLFVNYPNNPTGAIATNEFYKELVDFANDNSIVVCSDNPYSLLGFDGYTPLSFLEVHGAKEVGIEINSLSKPYNMTGWRVGMVVGNADVIAAMKITKNNVDSGVFTAVQSAAIVAMGLPDRWLQDLIAVYQKRRDSMVTAFHDIGMEIAKPKGALYLWLKVPAGETSSGFAGKVLEKTGVVITPGNGYGPEGEGYCRLSLTVPDRRIEEAIKRIREMK